LKTPVQPACLRLDRGLTEEGQRTGRGTAAAACHPKPDFACPGQFFSSLLCWAKADGPAGLLKF